ncbi:diaminopimelate epimerase [Bacteroidia bacterium]|nr:diaminopimelate epimerase [Bacteroidia bacterium]
MQFTKMHGTGNDYVYIDCTDGKTLQDVALLANKISNRHFGVGSDGLVLIERSNIADFKMRMFNADGSESAMCGNASRCIGKYVYDRGLTKKTKLTLETLSGIKHLSLFVQDGKVNKVSVDMGSPSLQSTQIPVAISRDRVVAEKHRFGTNEFSITCVSMGNPHTVIFVDDVEHFDVHGIGRLIENDSLFPERTNVEFAQIEGRAHIRMRVWERGSGETLACGSGACATLVAAVLNNLTDRKAVVQTLGGDLEIQWQDAQDGTVLLTGDAITVFEGVLDEL